MLEFLVRATEMMTTVTFVFIWLKGYSSSPLEVGGPKGVGTVYHEKICSHVSPGRMLGTCVFFMVTEVLRVFS